MAKLFFVSLGCDKNLVDSEQMLGLLVHAGYQITDEESEADVIVVNTCCFIGDAKEESINTILEMTQYRKNGRCRALIVTGCLAQRYREEIIQEIPEVDCILGTMSWDRILQAANEALAGNEFISFEDCSRRMDQTGSRVLTTGGHYAYLKIAEGCDRHCTYCVIPGVRGRYRSFPMEQLLDEAARLAEGGVKELILVAQETTLYGTDLYGEKSLHTLLKKLCQIPALCWIRILYCYPEEIYDDLLQTMQEEPKICHYLDLPIQHCNDQILRRMGRKTTRADLEKTIDHIRSMVPDIALRTTLITGFPGETPEMHEELMEFINEMEFDRLGVFPYSQEEGTPAALMEDQVDEETKLQRRDELMELQQEIAQDLCEERIGQILEAMVEGQISGEDTYVCRTGADAPGVDGYLFLHTSEVLCSGDFAKVRVTGALEYDLIGELADA